MRLWIKLASIDVKLADWTYWFPEKPVVNAFRVKLMEAGQDLNVLILYKAFNTDWAAMHVKISSIRAKLILVKLTLRLVVVCRESWDKDLHPLCGLSSIVVVQLRKHVVVVLIEISLHSLEL
jgi:hypothetical protein